MPNMTINEESITIQSVKKNQLPLDASFVHLSPPRRRASYRNHNFKNSSNNYVRGGIINNVHSSSKNTHYNESLGASLYEEDYSDSPFFNNGILSTHKYMTSLLQVTEKSLQNFNKNDTTGTFSVEHSNESVKDVDCRSGRDGDDLICLCDNDIQR